MHPGTWKLNAIILLRASDKIYDAYSAAKRHEEEHDEDIHGLLKEQEVEDLLDLQLYPIYLLLIGYTVESLVKGIIFSKNPSLLISGEKLSEDHTKNHALVDRYQETGLPMDRDTKAILSGLEQFIVWKGRYAIPKNISIYMGQRKFPKILYDRTKLESLIGYLISELDKIPSLAFENAKLEFT